ncbi:MAG: FkbM family methyltransferase [Bacteroidia bacterium]|nr:FkbM family methyltransferase [Bacteroidia bacterium]
MNFVDLRQFAKYVLDNLGIIITQNQRYDKYTREVIQSTLKPDSNSIDVGCHKGEILDIILKFSPNGKHFCFEPIPYLYENLLKNYGSKAQFFDLALAEENGTATFNIVKNAPAYSGLRKRQYKVAHPEIEEIPVQVKRLDEVVPLDVKIDLIKIDVEGAEYNVFKGAREILIKHKPVVIFDCGLGASDYYGTKPEDLFDLLHSYGLHICLLGDYTKTKQKLSRNDFINIYQENKEYAFVAFP